MEEEIARLTSKFDKTNSALNMNIDKERFVVLNNIEDINFLANCKNTFETKQIETLILKSSNFRKFTDHF